METGITTDEIIDSALHLPAHQRWKVADAILGSLQKQGLKSFEPEEGKSLAAFLSDRLDSANQGRLSQKNFSQIKSHARTLS